MTKAPKEYRPGRGYKRKDWDEIESPEATDEQLAQAKPFAEALPALADSIKRGPGRPPVANPRQQISIRLSPEVIEHYKATGPGWQTRIDEALKKAAGL